MLKNIKNQNNGLNLIKLFDFNFTNRKFLVDHHNFKPKQASVSSDSFNYLTHIGSFWLKISLLSIVFGATIFCWITDENLTIIYSSCVHQQDISISFCLNLNDLSLAEYWTSKQAISIKKRKCAEFIYANSSKILDQTIISNFDPHLINIIWSEVDPCFFFY